MTEATEHHTEIGSDRDARLASWACICGKSEVIHFARAAGEPVALRLMRVKADLHERGETETERLMRIKADLHERGETETDMRDPNEALLIAVREAVTEARRAGATEMACLWDAAVAAVDKGAHGEPSPEARKLADSIRRLMTPTPDPRETAPEVRPEDVPAEWVVSARRAWTSAPQKRNGAPTRMIYALAAVYPLIDSAERAKVAELKAEVERLREKAAASEAVEAQAVDYVDDLNAQIAAATRRAEQAEAERDKERRRAESIEDLSDALMGYLNKARDAADAKDWPSLPIAIAALRKRAEQAEAEREHLRTEFAAMTDLHDAKHRDWQRSEAELERLRRQIVDDEVDLDAVAASLHQPTEGALDAG